jgi:putative peptidoglycan lipid II flippase
MLKSSGGIGAATLTSRVLGLVREQVYTAFMGTGLVYGAFIYAYQVPNLFRRLLGEGALTAAFIPIFKAKEKNDGEAEMWRSANAVLSGLAVVSGGLVLLVMAIVSVLLLSHSWSDETRLMLRLLRMMFPYMVFVCVGAVFIGMCNARGHFFIPALGSAVLNVVMIASVILLAPRMGKTLDTQIFALAIGVVVAGVVQAGFQVPTLLKEGFRYQWVSPWRHPVVREVMAKMAPSIIGVSAYQINILLTQSLAFGENARIVGQFAVATRLMELPQGVFGLSLATFLLPTLAALAVEKNFQQFRATLRQGVEHLLFVNLLATVLLFTLAEPIVRLLFERGKFDVHSTHMVSYALMCLVPGLTSFSLVNIFARGFYATGDIKTPMWISVFSLAVNTLFAAFFLFGLQLGPGALGLANSISSFCNLGLLIFALRKKLGKLEMAETIALLPRLALGSIAAGLMAWGVHALWERYSGHATLAQKLGEVFVPMTVATIGYFGWGLLAKIPSAGEMLRVVQGRASSAAKANAAQ